jgi:hypothetical protein
MIVSRARSGIRGLNAGLDALCGTPRRELRGQLEQLARRKPLPDWVRPLADGETAAVTRLAGVLRVMPCGVV